MKSYFSFPGWTIYLWLGLEQCTKESIAISPDLPVELHEIKTYRRYARRNKYEFQARTDHMNLITQMYLRFTGYFFINSSITAGGAHTI